MNRLLKNSKLKVVWTLWCDIQKIGFCGAIAVLCCKSIQQLYYGNLIFPYSIEKQSEGKSGKIDPKKWGGTPDWDKYINTYYPYQ